MFTSEYCSGMGPAGWLLMAGFWAAVIAVIVWAVTRLFPKESTGGRSPAVPHQRQDPQELLDQRLASDEIDPQTYFAARRELTGTGQGGGPAATAAATTAGPTCRCP